MFLTRADALRDEGQTVVFVAIDGRLAGILGVADPIKESAAEAVSQLHQANLKVVMLTGDNRATAGRGPEARTRRCPRRGAARA